MYVYCHIDDAGSERYDWRKTDPMLDVSVFLPGASKVCTIAPLGALANLLPSLHRVLSEPDAERLRCEGCGAEMDVPRIARPEGALMLGETPYQLGAAIAQELGED